MATRWIALRRNRIDKDEMERRMNPILLNRTKSLVIIRPELFTPEQRDAISLVDAALDISSTAGDFLLDEKDDFDLTGFKLAQPRTYSNAVWFEYVLPDSVSLSGRWQPLNRDGEHVGVLCYWKDNNETKYPPRVLTALLVLGGAHFVKMPQFIQIPIELDGRLFGEDIVYAYFNNGIPISKNDRNEAEAAFGFFITPAFMKIHNDYRRHSQE